MFKPPESKGWEKVDAECEEGRALKSDEDTL